MSNPKINRAMKLVKVGNNPPTWIEVPAHLTPEESAERVERFKRNLENNELALRGAVRLELPVSRSKSAKLKSIETKRKRKSKKDV